MIPRSFSSQRGDNLQHREFLRKEILSIFGQAGFSFISPSILQPADIFLDYSGEAIRSRTFVFQDPSGKEICLRPDLTVPTCLYHLQKTEDPSLEARYSYCGPVFRFEGDASSFHSYECEQIGVEWFGASEDKALCEARLLALALWAIEACGIFDYQVKIGDLDLFRSLLEGLSMPQRWQRRLLENFWRPHLFRTLLETFSGERERKQTSVSPLIDALSSDSLQEAVSFVQNHLDAQRLEIIGNRSPREIASRLVEKKKDRTEPRLSARDLSFITEYLAICGNLDKTCIELSKLQKEVGAPLMRAFSFFQNRILHLEKEKNERLKGRPFFEFSSLFGRNFEYYTGFVFQIEVQQPSSEPLVLAGGGRYDHLLSEIGARAPIPALGCALHMENILSHALLGAKQVTQDLAL